MRVDVGFTLPDVGFSFLGCGIHTAWEREARSLAWRRWSPGSEQGTPPCRHAPAVSYPCGVRGAEAGAGGRGAHTQADWRQPQPSSAPGAAERGVNPCWPRPPPPASLHWSSAISEFPRGQRFLPLAEKSAENESPVVWLQRSAEPGTEENSFLSPHPSPSLPSLFFLSLLFRIFIFCF